MSRIKLGADQMTKAALAIEELVAEAAATAIEDARRAGHRDGHAAGYADGRHDERLHWHARLLKLLDEPVSAPSPPGSLHEIFNAMFRLPPDRHTAAGVASTDARQPGTGRGEAEVAPITGAEGTAGDGPLPPPEAETPGQPGGVTPPPEPPTDPAAAAPKAADPEGPAGAEGVEKPSLPPQAEPEDAEPPGENGAEDAEPPGESDDEDAERPGESGAEADAAPPHSLPPGSPAPGGDWRTPAREAVLLKLWGEVGPTHRDIWLAMQQIDGPTMPKDPANLVHWARKLKLPDRPMRPDVAASNVRRGVAAAEARATQPPLRPASVASPPQPTSSTARPPGSAPRLPAASNGMHHCSYNQIKEWASHYGIIYNGANIDAVNKRRKLLGLKPVVQDEALTALEKAR